MCDSTQPTGESGECSGMELATTTTTTTTTTVITTSLTAASPVTSSLIVCSKPGWTGTLALTSKKDGKPKPISSLAAFAQLNPGEFDHAAGTYPPDIFSFDKWPLQILVSGVCPAREVVLQYKDVARVVVFKVLHNAPMESSDCAFLTSGPQGGAVPMGPGPLAAPAPVTPASLAPPETSYLSLMLGQLHRKGWASVLELPRNTLLLVPHKDRPLGILLPKLDLKCAHPNPYTGPPPIPGASTCAVCMEAPAVYALVPCGHLCLCIQDMQPYRASPKGGSCPMCRHPVTSTLRIYSS
jgi:hypothetical protein